MRIVRDASDGILRASRPATTSLRLRDLEGSQRGGHLGRLALDRTDEIRCWRMACGPVLECESCRPLGVLAGPPAEAPP